MGFFDIIKKKINQLFGFTLNIKYEDKELLAAFSSYPASLGENLISHIRKLSDDTHQVYNAANNKEFTIGIIGDFSVGKSTFVNALLGDRVVPVSATPCTAIITKIKYGKKPKAVVVYSDNRKIEMSYEDFITFSSFNISDFEERKYSEEIERFKDIKYAIIYIKSNFLKQNNLCIVDTLGLSADEADNKKTIASIKDAIAIIYICAERGLSERDTDFISTYLNIDNEDLFFCVNRIDLTRKNERDNIKQFVQLKLNDIRNLNDCIEHEASDHIYLVSSMYQEFANGYTEHSEWQEGIDYQARSGFVQMMTDIGEYVKANIFNARKRTINTHLKMTLDHIRMLKEYRKTEIDSLINENINKIKNIEIEIKRIDKEIEYKKTLFESLEQALKKISTNFFSKYSHSIDREWDYTLKSYILKQVSFGVGSYIGLEISIIFLYLNIFKSMKDSRYAKLQSLKPFVDEVMTFLVQKLQPFVAGLNGQIKDTITIFASKNSYHNIFSKQSYAKIEMQSFLFQRSIIENAMYRATAQAGVESTWVKNETRKTKMFNAAKVEGMKALEKNIYDYFRQMDCNITEYVRKCYQTAIQENIRNKEALFMKIHKEETEINIRKQHLIAEFKYFDEVIDTIGRNKVQ